MVAPPAKRLRTNKSVDPSPVDFEQIDQKIAKIIEAVSGLQSADPDQAVDLQNEVSMLLLQCKSLQRHVLTETKTLEQAVDKERVATDKLDLQRTNVAVLKASHDRIREQASKPDISQLLKLCKEAQSEAKGDQMQEDNPTDMDLVRSFLQVDPDDPEEKHFIMGTLQSEIKERKSSQAHLKRLQEEVSDLKSSLASKKKQLNEIPQKLVEVERASRPLQTFCRQSVNPDFNRTGSERREVNERAISTLPRPLYTLFCQFQSYLDSTLPNETLNDGDKYYPINLEVTDGSVVLSFPLPYISDGTTVKLSGKKVAQICFSYEQDAGVISARLADETSSSPTWIDGLFPGDSGEFVLYKDADGDDDDDHLAGAVTMRGIYQWCNYIAGIQFNTDGDNDEPNEKHGKFLSTKSVVTALARRLRSHIVLKHLLSTLARKPSTLPTYPDMPTNLEGLSDIKVAQWTEEDTVGLSSTLQRYRCVLKCGSETFRCTVDVDKIHYPLLPSKWTFAARPLVTDDVDGKSDTMVYDDALGDLEWSVNNDPDGHLLGDKNKDGNLRDWLLVHQLHRIASYLKNSATQ